VDGRELFGKPTGVGRYVLEVIRQWAAAPHDFTIVVPAEPSPELRGLGSSFHWWVEANAGQGTRWEQTRLPRALAKMSPDVFLAPANTAPFQLPCPFVVVVHDASYFAHPEWFGRRDGWRRRLLTRSAARRARTVVTVSEFSRQEISRYLKLPLERMAIASPAAAESSASHAGTREPVVLYVGSLFNRRRIPELMQAFSTASRSVPDARLILVGDNRTSPRVDPVELAKTLGILDRFEWREYVSDEELFGLYARARVFAFLSDYEGFGMTPLEALTHGVPSVLFDTAVTREVYGSGALLVEPTVEAISAGLTRLLTDADERARIVATGGDRLKTYQWTKTASTILQALEKAAE
jgi:glycosyltransferase involved in cell wall biosynthesis